MPAGIHPGRNDMLVFKGAVTVSSPTPTSTNGPAPFAIIIPLSVPFTYSSGSLQEERHRCRQCVERIGEHIHLITASRESGLGRWNALAEAPGHWPETGASPNARFLTQTRHRRLSSRPRRVFVSKSRLAFLWLKNVSAKSLVTRLHGRPWRVRRQALGGSPPASESRWA